MKFFIKVSSEYRRLLGSMDPLPLIGLAVAVFALLIGHVIGGGQLSSLLQVTALLIVLGGTIGAVLLQTPLPVFRRSIYMLRWVWQRQENQDAIESKKIIRWSEEARLNGYLSLEKYIKHESSPFLRRGLRLLVDGGKPDAIREALEWEIVQRERLNLRSVKVFEAMGGYCPTIGIIGAILGLMHVMQDLGSPEEIGGGVAVAFVATFYGVAMANLVFLPVAAKLRHVVEQKVETMDLLAEGIVDIALGRPPTLIETKFKQYHYATKQSF